MWASCCFLSAMCLLAEKSWWWRIPSAESNNHIPVLVTVQVSTLGFLCCYFYYSCSYIPYPVMEFQWPSSVQKVQEEPISTFKRSQSIATYASEVFQILSSTETWGIRKHALANMCWKGYCNTLKQLWSTNVPVGNSISVTERRCTMSRLPGEPMLTDLKF